MIYGERIRLRAIEHDDLPCFVAWLNDPEVTENLLIAYPLSLAAEEKWFEQMMSQSQFERPLAIEVREGNGWKMIGNLSLMDISWHNSNAELGIVLGDKAEWDKGYGTEAIRLLVKYAFEELNLHRVSLRVYATNPRAIHCYEKAGFEMEGTLRDSIFRHGKYIDLHVMSILRPKWEHSNQH